MEHRRQLHVKVSGMSSNGCYRPPLNPSTVECKTNEQEYGSHKKQRRILKSEDKTTNLPSVAKTSTTPKSSSSCYCYAVARGHNRGVFDNWEECKRNFQGFPNPRYAKFLNRTEALAFAFPERYPFREVNKLLSSEEGFTDEKDTNEVLPITTTTRTIKNTVSVPLLTQNHDGINLKPIGWVISDGEAAQILSREYRNLLLNPPTSVSENEHIIHKLSSLPEDSIHVWISGSKIGNGRIGLLFQDDQHYYTGPFTFKPPITLTRLRLEACIESLKKMDHFYPKNEQHSDQEHEDCSISAKVVSNHYRVLVVHTRNRYFSQCLSEWMKFECTIGPAWDDQDSQNNDIIRCLFHECKIRSIRILPVYHNKVKSTALPRNNDSKTSSTHTSNSNIDMARFERLDILLNMSESIAPM